MIKLKKFCKTEHNITKACRKIQLGSFNYYKTIENEDLKDETEGSDSVEINSHMTDSADSKTKGYLEQTNIHFGAHNIVENCKITTSFPNSLLYCCSIDTSNTQVSDKYDDFFEIPDPNSFSKFVLHRLMATTTLDWFDKNIQKLPLSELARIQLFCIHQKVIYVENTCEISDSRINSEIPMIFRQAFCKPPIYKKNREYRFLFFYNHPDLGVIPITKDKILIDIIPL